MSNSFDWGINDPHLSDIIHEEIFVNRIYEKYVEVKENDIVLDIGANVGAFTYSILHKKPNRVICLEPSNTLVKTLAKNVKSKNVNVEIVNAAIGKATGENIITDQVMIYNNDGNKYNVIALQDLISEFNIDHVDFLKIDCEGGEYSVFTENNKKFIINNISHIAGEFHVWGYDNAIENFIYFRDVYLRDHKNYIVLDRHDNDVTDKIWDDNYIRDFAEFHNHSAQFIVYLTNKKGEINSMNKIPVIGAAVVNSSYWVSRLIMSVDYPVENFVIVNNNGRGELDTELNNLVNIKHKYIDNIKVVHMPANIGCAGAWNIIIKCYMNAPYWIIVNDDVAFGPGLLEEMATLLKDQPDVGMIHPNPGDYNLGAWDLFLISENVVETFGLFDENTYPAYCEDADYIMRYVHKPIYKIVGTKNSYLHGESDSKDYYSEDGGSQTRKNDPNLKEILEKSNELNIEYLTRKWGPGWRNVQPRELPFMDEEKDISTTKYDLKFVRSKYTGF